MSTELKQYNIFYKIIKNLYNEDMKNSHFIILLALALLVVFYFFGNPYSTKLVNYPPKNSKIVVFGDSLAFGKGSTEGNDFVTLLGKKLRKNIINLGNSGDTTGDALLRISEVYLQDPGTVIIIFGGNDYMRNVPKEDTFKNLRQIVALLQSKGIFVVVLGVRGGVLIDHFDNLFEDLSKEMGTAYVPDIMDGLIGDARYMSDPVHPNDEGYKLIAEKVYDKAGKYLKYPN